MVDYSCGGYDYEHIYISVHVRKSILLFCSNYDLEMFGQAIHNHSSNHSNKYKTAAKLILKSRRTEHCKPLLKQLHWLPIEQNQIQDILSLSDHITGIATRYLAEPVHIYFPSRSLRSSSDDRTFCIPISKRKQHGGGHSVSLLQKPGIISLALFIIAPLSLPALKANLKTHLFREYFD